MEEDNDPWGNVCKIVTARVKKEIRIMSLRKRDGRYTELVEET